jgi:hypothetical protein
MLNNEQKAFKERLLQQVKRYEEKGYMNTAAHTCLSLLLTAESEGGVPAKNTKKVKQESADGE